MVICSSERTIDCLGRGYALRSIGCGGDTEDKPTLVSGNCAPRRSSARVTNCRNRPINPRLVAVPALSVGRKSAAHSAKLQPLIHTAVPAKAGTHAGDRLGPPVGGPRLSPGL